MDEVNTPWRQTQRNSLGARGYVPHTNYGCRRWTVWKHRLYLETNANGKKMHGNANCEYSEM